MYTFQGYSACPNKYNIYHECTKKCKELWGAGHLQPSDSYLKKQMKLIQKYPLPETWRAVYDVGRYIKKFKLKLKKNNKQKTKMHLNFILF